MTIKMLPSSVERLYDVYCPETLFVAPLVVFPEAVRRPGGCLTDPWCVSRRLNVVATTLWHCCSDWPDPVTLRDPEWELPHSTLLMQTLDVTGLLAAQSDGNNHSWLEVWCCLTEWWCLWYVDSDDICLREYWAVTKYLFLCEVVWHLCIQEVCVICCLPRWSCCWWSNCVELLEQVLLFPFLLIPLPCGYSGLPSGCWRPPSVVDIVTVGGHVGILVELFRPVIAIVGIAIGAVFDGRWHCWWSVMVCSDSECVKLFSDDIQAVPCEWYSVRAVRPHCLT